MEERSPSSVLDALNDSQLLCEIHVYLWYDSAEKVIPYSEGASKDPRNYTLRGS